MNFTIRPLISAALLTLVSLSGTAGHPKGTPEEPGMELQPVISGFEGDLIGPKAPLMDRWHHGHQWAKAHTKLPANWRYCNKECGQYSWTRLPVNTPKYKKMCRVLKKQLRICPKKCPGKMERDPWILKQAKKCWFDKSVQDNGRKLLVSGNYIA